MRVLDSLEVAGSIVMSADNTAFPANPQPGTLLIKGFNLYAYLTVGGLQTWYPLVTVNQGNTYLHTQGVASTQWTVTHNLNTDKYWYQIQDTAGDIVYPISVVPIDANSFTVNFASPVVGTMIVVGTNNLIMDNINASLIKLGANVSLDTAGMLINGSRVLNSVDTTALINVAISAEVTARNAAIATAVAGVQAGGNIPTVVSAFTNDANYQNATQVTAAVNVEAARAGNAEATLQGALTSEVNRATAAEAALQSAINALPQATPVPTLVSAFTNDAGYQTAANVTTATSGKANLAGGNTFTGEQLLGLINKGTISTGSAMLTPTEGNAQRVTVGGNITIDLTSWNVNYFHAPGYYNNPLVGLLSEMLLELINAGAYSVTMPVNVIWPLPTTGIPAASFAAYLTAIGRTALQSAGSDFFYFWSTDGGVTIYGKLL